MNNVRALRRYLPLVFAAGAVTAVLASIVLVPAVAQDDPAARESDSEAATARAADAVPAVEATPVVAPTPTSTPFAPPAATPQVLQSFPRPPIPTLTDEDTAAATEVALADARVRALFGGHDFRVVNPAVWHASTG